VVKNKMAPPFRKAEFEIRYGDGICREAELIDIGVDTGVVKKSGAHLSFDGERIAHGRDKALVRLKSEPELAAKILDGINAAAAPAEVAVDDEAAA
jgi:recombination protein RecA